MGSFLAELRRRNVFKVAAAYAIVGWLSVQIADVFFPALRLPAWTVTLVAALIVLGFPVAIVLAWAYELTPEGIKKTRHVPLEESVSHAARQKLNYVVTGLLALAVAFMAVDAYLIEDHGTREGPQTSQDPTIERSRPNTEPSEEPERDLRSIAVLPFDNRSAQAGDRFFVDGIHDDILTQLAKISDLKVISRTSVMEYREGSRNMREIGQALGVATILEGAVQRAGDTVRISVQLIDAEKDEHLDAWTYDRALTAENIFAIQTEMATSIAEALEATLSPEEATRLAEVPTRNLRAYNFYLSGNDYIRRPDNSTGYLLAAQQYRRSVEADPEFALAWAALARAHSGVYFFRLDRSETRRQDARDAVERAFELAPDLPEAHLAMGFYHYHVFRDYERALEEFAIAERGIPGDPIVRLGRAYVYRRLGDFEQAVTSLEQAIELDPRNVELPYTQAGNYFLLRSYDEANRYLDLTLDMAPDSVEPYAAKALSPLLEKGDAASAKMAAGDPPFDLGYWRPSLGWIAAIYQRDYDAALLALDESVADLLVFENLARVVPKASLYGVTYQLSGQHELAEREFRTAREQVEEALEADPEDPRLLIALGEALAGLGERAAAVRAANRVLGFRPTSRDATDGPWLHYDAIIRVLVPAGDIGAAIRQLDAYLAGPGQWSIEGLLPDPRLDPIRGEPGFLELVAKYEASE